MTEPTTQKGLVPKLRFPEFRGALCWKTACLRELIQTVAAPRKFQTHEYQPFGKFPIIDQSQSPIAGWTDDSSAIVQTPSPLIVFGDHTCAIKKLTRPFAQGADGIKILQASDSIDTVFLYHALNNKPLLMEEYKRHFATLCDRVIALPNTSSAEYRIIADAEQRKIAECLESLDELIAAETEKLEALKRHKKGLLQQLFPAEGETIPRIRFPHFRGSGEWRILPLAQVCLIRTGKKDVNEGSAAGVYPFFTCAATVSQSDSFSFDSEAVLIAGNADSVGRAKYYKGKFEAYQRTYVLDTFRNVSARYAFALLDEFFQTYCQSQFQTTAMNYITLPILGNFQLPLPMSDAEQDAIAQVSFDLSAMVEIMSTRLAKLRAHKAALMQQLFPSLDELESPAA